MPTIDGQIGASAFSLATPDRADVSGFSQACYEGATSRAPMPTPFTHRLATLDDVPTLNRLMDAAIGALMGDFLSPEQVEASRTIMGLDTQLIEDGCYFVVEDATNGAPVIAGSGGWSRRATLYGGDHTPGRDAAWLDPATDAVE
jgi:hypothetical protein